MKSLVEYLDLSQINEMASSLTELRTQVNNISDQILQNWCLVKLADEYPDKSFSIDRNHWASELKGHMNSITKIKVKSGRKDKTIRNVWIDVLELDDPIEVSKAIRKKFNEEGLQKYVNKISYECAGAADEIVRILSSTRDDVESYIQGELG